MDLKRIAPYLLLLPGLAWLVLFYVVPIVTLFLTSLHVDPSAAGNVDGIGMVSAHLSNYTTGLTRFHAAFSRSLLYALSGTIISLVLAYPLAYFIVFRAGRWQLLLLMLIVAPFFTDFLIRTLALGSVLGYNGWVSQGLSFFGITKFFNLNGTPALVIIGLVYNFFAFMLLPIYANLQKLDINVLDAAGDLYSTPLAVMIHVLLPLSLPGIVAGTLLTFIPTVGDFINAQLLGSTATTMIGNMVYSQFLIVRNYPLASALSFCIIIGIVLIVSVYMRSTSSDDLL